MFINNKCYLFMNLYPALNGIWPCAFTEIQKSQRKGVLFICWRLKLWIHRVLSVLEFRLPGKQDFLPYHPWLADIQLLNSTRDRVFIIYESSSFLSTTVLLARACLQSIEIYLSTNSTHKILCLPITLLKIKLNHHYFIKCLLKEWRQYYVRLKSSLVPVLKLILLWYNLQPFPSLGYSYLLVFFKKYVGTRFEHTCGSNTMSLLFS